jgi:hypothetical protein
MISIVPAAKQAPTEDEAELLKEELYLEHRAETEEQEILTGSN